MKAYPIGSRRELFIDDLLTEYRHGLDLKTHTPHPQVMEPTQPSGFYMTMLQQEGRIHCYYRQDFSQFTGENSPYSVKPGFINEYTAYAQSQGGSRFLIPPLFLHDCGVPNVLHCMETGTHNFCPFYDQNPSCPPGERYKAIAGVSDQGGIFGFVSPDPIHFQRLSQAPIISPLPEWDYCFDSQNVAFYSLAEQCYVCYFRMNRMPDGRKLRTFAKMTSPDFRTWENISYPAPNQPGEHLYVSLLAPYPRAPHIYVGTPTRYFEERGSATDIALMFSREGGPIIRPNLGAWIKPGPDPQAWQNRSNYLAYNLIQTKPDELSIYHARSQQRYTLRTDGFMSLTAGIKQGEWLSIPLRYDGGQLECNVATSAGGSFQVELQHEDGTPIPGCSMAESTVYYGDSIAYRPTWRNVPTLPLNHGDIIRIRCLMQDCDFFSFSFQQQEK